MVDFSIDWIKKPGGFLKVIALVLMLICLGLYFHFGTHPAVLGVLGGVGSAGYGGFYDVSAANLCCLVISTNIFMLLYYIISYILGESFPAEYPISESIFLLLHGILSFACAFCIFGGRGSSGSDDGIAASRYSFFVFLFIVSILLFVDATFLIIKMIREGSDISFD